VTGTNNGVEEKLVLACPDEAEGQKWIAGLNKFAHTDKIKAAKEEVKVYKEKLAAYKEEVARISKARAVSEGARGHTCGDIRGRARCAHDVDGKYARANSPPARFQLNLPHLHHATYIGRPT
jgi:hypothetical protein